MKRQKSKGTVNSRIKRGDEVVFVAGREYNRFDSEGNRNPYRGKVIAVEPGEGRIKVDGAMMVKKHRKPVPQMNITGGIISKEAWVDISNVAVVDPETGDPTRVRYEERDGAKVRVAKSGAVIEEPAAFARVETSTTEEAEDAEKLEEAADGSSEESKSEEKAESEDDAKPAKDSKTEEE